MEVNYDTNRLYSESAWCMFLLPFCLRGCVYSGIGRRRYGHKFDTQGIHSEPRQSHRLGRCTSLEIA